jgi:1-deoxy-D-xylulose-5-phosphate reductoisomerase
VSEQKKKVIVLGSTGSIGKNTLDVCRKFKDSFEVKALSCNRNLDELLRQIAEFSPVSVAIAGNGSDRSFVPSGCKVYGGESGLLEMIRECDADIVVNGIAGARGLMPSVAAIESGKSLALANKETIVMAGSLIMEMAQKNGVEIVQVDSEHSGLFQLIRQVGASRVVSLTITASGGAIRNLATADLAGIKVEDVLKHPTWSMGKKITIDSSTGANKGLEIIEAHHLFGMKVSQIDVLVHPQSLVHSIVKTADGYFYLQVSDPDMRLAIHHALFYPCFRPSSFGSLDLTGKNLEFFPVDFEKYKMIRIGYNAAESGGAYPIVYNAANEVAVQAFLDGILDFTGIPELVSETIARNWQNVVASMEEIIRIDGQSREIAGHILTKLKKG